MVADRAVAGARGALTTLPAWLLGAALAVPVAAVLIAGLRPESLETLTSSRTWAIIGFTMLQAALSTAASMAVALPAAFALHRLRVPGGAALRAILTLPFVLPTIVVGLAVRVLLPDAVGTLLAIVLAHMVFNIGVAVRIVGSAWSHLDERLLDLSRTLGLTPWGVWRKVTWPFLRPAVLSACVVIGLFTFTSFGVIVVLGSRPTIEVEIYRQTVVFLDLPAAAALALVQGLAVIAALAVSGRLEKRVRDRARLAPPQARRPRSGADRAAVLWSVLVASAICLPLLALVIRSLRVGDGWGVEWYQRMWMPTELTTRATPAAESIAVSLRYALIATAIALTLGVTAAIGLAQRRTSRVAEVVLLLPLGVSAVTIGFGLLLVSIHGPVDLRGSSVLVPLGQALVATPLVVVVLTPVLRSIDVRLRAVAATLGAPPRRSWWAVEGAALRRHVPVAAALAAAVSLGEFGATAFLARADAPTIPLLIVRLLGRPGEANIGTAAALGVLLLALTAAIVLIGDRLRPRWAGR